MSSKQSQHTKETLKQHQENFKKLESNLDSLREEFKRKIIKEINALDQQEKIQSEKAVARKKALALKGIVKGAYAEDQRSSEEVPVDGQVKAGTMVYTKHCYVCHSLEAVDPKPRRGPSLGLIYNRRVGSNLNYEHYTDSMLKSSFFWNDKNLYNFMANPQALVPKTSCGLVKSPLKSEEDRADLITMFRQFTTELTFNIRWKEIQRVGYSVFQANLHAEYEEKKRGDARDQRQKKKQNRL